MPLSLFRKPPQDPPKKIFAVCKDCGTLKDESHDGSACDCGGVFHVESARCMACGMRHSFSRVGEHCDCEAKGEIVPKRKVCPGCGGSAPHDLDCDYCPGCNLLFKLEG